MNAIEKAENEELKLQVKHWRNKFTNAVEGGIRTAQRAMNRRKRADDLRRAYVLAAEELFKQAGLENPSEEWSVVQKRAHLSFTLARQELGLVRREHTAEQCGGKCKYHKGAL